MTQCGRICIGKRKINLRTVFAGQTVGLREEDDGKRCDQTPMYTAERPSGARLALLRGGERVVLLPIDGHPMPRTDVAVMIIDRDLDPIRLAKNLFVDETRRASRNTKENTSGSDWLRDILAFQDDGIVVRTLDGLVFRIDLATGRETALAAQSASEEGEKNPDWGLCGSSFAATAPPARYLCSETSQPPVPPAGIPDMLLCNHDEATIVWGGVGSNDEEGRANGRRVAIGMIGKTYHLKLNTVAERRDSGEPDVAYSMLHPNIAARARGEKASLASLMGEVEGDPQSLVTGVRDRTGVLSLEIKTTAGASYVVRRRLSDGRRGSADDMIAYRAEDLARGESELGGDK